MLPGSAIEKFQLGGVELDRDPVRQLHLTGISAHVEAMLRQIEVSFASRWRVIASLRVLRRLTTRRSLRPAIQSGTAHARQQWAALKRSAAHAITGVIRVSGRLKPHRHICPIIV